MAEPEIWYAVVDPTGRVLEATMRRNIVRTRRSACIWANARSWIALKAKGCTVAKFRVERIEEGAND